MFYSNGYNIQMTEGDFGIELPITMTGPTFAAEDSVKLTIKDAINGNTLLEKDFSNIQNNTINFELTREESEQLPVGSYVYSLDWFQTGHFLCNIIPASAYKVVEKA